MLQLFETEEDMQAGDRAFGAMDAAETPGTRVSVDMGELKIDVRVGGPEGHAEHRGTRVRVAGRDPRP